jgi:hypothetical protein
LDLGLGLGYRVQEFEVSGVDRRDRGRKMYEGVEPYGRCRTCRNKRARQRYHADPQEKQRQFAPSASQPNQAPVPVGSLVVVKII